jgi:trk system potassium uptake protein TrkA
MRQYAFIGLGALAMCMLESVVEVTDNIVVIDKDPVLIDRVKDMVKAAFVADVLDEEALERIFPDAVDVAIIDLSSSTDAALLATHRLKKLGVKEIIVKSESDERSEVLKLIGATRVVNSDREAAARIVPLILSSSLYNFVPIGGDMVMAEVHVPARLLGKSLVDADLRKNHGVNVVAIRSENSTTYRNFNREYKMAPDDFLLVAGNESDVFDFSGIKLNQRSVKKRPEISSLFKNLFKARKR